ncbi:bifunctional glycosyltransferase family 2 protein/CDP-glycerol:glycerophosphate glycerophosphotransferase [Actinomadura barringtoniae]|uniref:Bifunctional glycosyltransferase family 2 protein/CDP-glycerol:glycerophosphate glycerophosphotransferase n=1 Tax=Actinomadura barringtoniae TaxID=1427535 RepID=A0A939PR83_9ACTN|nr:bifunctional glycosyltransferase family 2 protein/CDP-glycerol:glycerophosphate glycerophosphotransferase [Actinomadura barringtoniae]MBO2454773.1 bifunctional glycosyltransferase family 2 protein/CDP-glycerol:glycerophosphate glycerophosphotransferase [Actinomadura barringtoniae]
MSPKLSAVVPFYNVEDYIDACLRSLARQSHADLEVIMVDDGSQDGSAAIAERYSREDRRFRLVRQQNQGLGPARNTGARHASGEFLAFADSDDVVPPYAYERMVRSLESSGSDLVTGAVQILSGSDRLSRATFYGEAFRATRIGTHVSRDAELLHDRTAWNRVFRRSFYDEHALEFPPGAYEDAPVTIPAHVLAEKVDVLSDVVYHYRRREGGERSITQRRTEIGNARDRVASIRSVSRFLAESAPGLKGAYDLTCLDNDLMLFINVLEEGDEAYRYALCELVDDYLGELDPALLDRLTSLRRLKYHLARERRVGDLLTVLEYERTGLPAGEYEARGVLRRRWYAGHPFRGDTAVEAGTAPVPDAVYDATAEMRVIAQVDEISWESGSARVDGHAYVPGVPMTLDDGIDVWLQHTRTRRRVRLDVERSLRPEVTANSRQPAVSYDGSGFSVTIDPKRLRSVPSWKNADWTMHVAVHLGPRRPWSRPLRGVVARCGAGAAWSTYRDVPGQARVQLVPADDAVTVRVRRTQATITDHRWSEGALEIEGWLGEGVVPEDQTVTVRCRERGATEKLPLELLPADGDSTPFRLRVPLPADRAVPTEPINWELSVKSQGKAVRLTAPPDFTESVHTSVNNAFRLTRTRYGNAVLTQGPPVLVFEALTMPEDGRMVVTGRLAGEPAERPSQLVLRRRRTDVEHAFPLTWDCGRFTAVVDLASITTLAGALPLATGTWELRASIEDVAVVATKGLLASLPPALEVAGHRFRLWPAASDGLTVESRIARADGERGPHALRMLRERDYPAFLRSPIRDLVMFESYFGWQYSCNPKAIYEEFVRRDTGHELVWVMGDQHFVAPEGARVVQRFSREYYELTAAARIVVNNVAQPTCYRSRDGQSYVQTWHGTPIKSVGFDMDWSQMERRDQRRRDLVNDVARWDLLLTQNAFSTEVMRRAFHYEGEVLEAGYPRNDLAYGPRSAEIRAAVRARLGVPEGKKAVLYAPTWRDHLQTSKHGLARQDLLFDFARAAEALGDDTVLLLRRHHLMNAGLPESCASFVIDVTRYPDVTELYLAADAMVTDYSSAMVDFAGLGKPLLLFTPDLDAYRDDIRGLAFDLSAHQPGPMLKTSEELIATLGELDAVAAASRDQLTAFAAEFCPLDDGRASARVVDRLLSLERWAR